MKIRITAFLLISTAAMSGCSLWPWRHNKQPKSSYKIIEEGEKNPFIVDRPESAGTTTRNIDVESGPIKP